MKSTKDRILQILLRKPKLRLNDLAEAVEINPISLRHHLSNLEKEGLIAAVLERRFGPPRQEHLHRLREFEEQAGGEPVPLEKILEAMLLPPLRLAGMDPAKRQAVMRLLGRIVAEPNPQFQELVHKRRKDGERLGFTANY